MIKNYILRYIPQNIKITISRIVADTLFKASRIIKFYRFDKFLIILYLKSNQFKKIRTIISYHEKDLNYERFLETVDRYEALGENIHETRFWKEQMLDFYPEKYNQLIKTNKNLIDKYPKDYLLHDRMARNFVAGGFRNKAKFHFSESLKLQRKEKILNEKTGLIIVASMSRSGSGHISRSILKGLGIKKIQIPYFDSWYPDYCIIDLPNYVRHWSFSPMPDGFWIGHIPALKNNLWNISLITDKIVVNFRDPRQQLISVAHHMEYLRLNGHSTSLIQYRIPDEYFLWSFEKKLDWQIENYSVPVAIEWIKGWLEADSNVEFPCKIFFCQQLSLKINQKKYFQDILNFYGLSDKNFIYPSMPKFQERTTMRKGSVDEWKEILTSEQIKKINKLIPETWFKKFDWEEK